MALIFVKRFVFVTISALLLSAEASIKPQILSQYETIVDSGQNFTTLCQGNVRLTWSSPEVPPGTEGSEGTVIHVTDEAPQDKSFQYASRLFVENITFPFTGFYKCHSRKSSSEDDLQSSKIYLFVRDEKQLSVSTTPVETIIVTQYNVAVIPCRPTSPDVNVELTLLAGEKVTLGIFYENYAMYRFHPHFGFITNDTQLTESKLLKCVFTRDGQSEITTVVLDIEGAYAIPNVTFNPQTGFSFFVSHLSYEDSYVCVFKRGSSESEMFFYLKVSPITDSLAVPLVEEVSNGHTVIGETLRLVCKIRTLSQITFEWRTPTGPPDPKRVEVSQLMKDVSDLGVIYQNLIIKNAKLQDRGTYTCLASDNQNHLSSNSINATVFDVNEHFIELTEENGLYELPEMAGAPLVRWSITIRGHPEPKISWLNNNNETIPLGISHKYSTTTTPTVATVEIKDISITDFGNYTLVAENEFETKTLTLFLNVTDKPSVHIESSDFHPIDKPSMVKCIAAAYPKPQIQWYFKPCQGEIKNCSYKRLNESRSEHHGLQLVSYVNISTRESGSVKCFAHNSLGEDEAIQGFYVSDVKDGLDIFGLGSTVDWDESTNRATVAKGESIAITCGASVHNYTNTIEWYRGSNLILSDDKYTIEKSFTQYTYRAMLRIQEIDFPNGGSYSCHVTTKNKDVVYENITIVVSVPSAPLMNQTNLMKDIVTELPRKLVLYCMAWGLPKPEMVWYKNDKILELNGRVRPEHQKQKIIFAYTEVRDEGTYKCEARNKLGSVFKQVNITFSNRPEDFNKWLIVAIIGLILLLSVAAGVVIIKIRNERKLQKELQIAGLANFEKGAIENLNPDLGIDDQAELLPYDKKWELPIEKLKLGKQLGSGAFGVVMKGVAKGIVEGEESTTVAVKMVKKNADHTFIKALASELKIMVHLGKHLNVVNLLGACTKNVAKRELLVIVEYCRFGNLHNYLLRHRDNFINQVDQKTERIDYTIGKDDLERTYSVSSSRSNPQSPYLKYAALSFSNSNTDAQVPTEMADYRGKNYCGTTARTDMTTVSMSPSTGANNTGEEGMVVSNNSIQPEWRTNYRGDYKGNVKPICTKDLLAWAFQVSRGMEYLASRKVLHGDLAARNILLADSNVVKICDFGLAKSMYKSDNYKKRGDGPLPVKWMAIESIRDRVFSTQSDVWSFGIVLWEFFSLARTPYPGMEADERLYQKLVDGYRMESPEFSPKEVYKMMLDCWKPKPSMRPTFTKLEERIGSMLEDTVRKHYIDLNDPYLVMNTQRLEDGHSDYLSMLSPPNFENLSSPHNYANDLPPIEETPGYLCMKPNTIFSPRAEDTAVFDFNTKSKKDPTDGTTPEMIPMLAYNTESDCDSSACNSPVVNSFSNPSYHLPPVVGKDAERSEKDIVKFADNYVNMPQSKSAAKEKNNNPFVKVDEDSKDVHYVNSNSRDWESVNV